MFVLDAGEVGLGMSGSGGVSEMIVRLVIASVGEGTAVVVVVNKIARLLLTMLAAMGA